MQSASIGYTFHLARGACALLALYPTVLYAQRPPSCAWTMDKRCNLCSQVRSPLTCANSDGAQLCCTSACVPGTCNCCRLYTVDGCAVILAQHSSHHDVLSAVECAECACATRCCLMMIRFMCNRGDVWHCIICNVSPSTQYLFSLLCWYTLGVKS